MQHFITLAIIMLPLSGCVNFAPPSSTPTPPPVSEQKAIETASVFCDVGHVATRETPYNPQTRLVALQRASELLGHDLTSGRSANLLVWLVTLDGTWEVVFGPPTRIPPGGQIDPTPTPTFLHVCSAVIDAITGQGIAVVNGKPRE